jgi:c-di-GMP-binding flagellar brake protein YcgR
MTSDLVETPSLIHTRTNDARSFPHHIHAIAMKPRMSERFPVRVEVSFFTHDADTERKGTIIDLSKGGCRVESAAQPKSGDELRLSILTPDYSWAMKVDRAIVRWVQGRHFGVEFASMHSSQRDRLTRFIMKVKQDRGY